MSRPWGVGRGGGGAGRGRRAAGASEGQRPGQPGVTEAGRAPRHKRRRRRRACARGRGLARGLAGRDQGPQLARRPPAAHLGLDEGVLVSAQVLRQPGHGGVEGAGHPASGQGGRAQGRPQRGAGRAAGRAGGWGCVKAPPAGKTHRAPALGDRRPRKRQRSFRLSSAPLQARAPPSPLPLPGAHQAMKQMWRNSPSALLRSRRRMGVRTLAWPCRPSSAPWWGSSSSSSSSAAEGLAFWRRRGRVVWRAEGRARARAGDEGEAGSAGAAGGARGAP
jgi:hypothetical protein